MGQLGGRSDVAGVHLGRGYVLLTTRKKDLREALLTAAAEVRQVSIGLHRAGHHLEVAHPAELVAAGAEHERPDGFFGLHFRRGHELGDGRHERSHPEQLRRRAAHDRGDLAFQDALAQTALDLLLAQGPCVQILLEQRVVALRGRFNELTSVLLDELLHVVRDRDLAALAVGRRHKRFQVQQVDDAAEVLLRADGEVEREWPGREVVAHGGDGAVEVGVLLVQLVDRHDPRLVRPVAVLPRDFGADCKLRCGSDDHDRGLRGPQTADHLAREIEEAGRIEDVDLVAVVLGKADAEVDRDLLLLFLGLEVHGGRGLVGGAHACDGAGGEKHGLREHGLAVVRVAQQNHVSDLVGSVVSRHPDPQL